MTKHALYVRLCLSAFFLITALSLSGCVIFSPVGHAISQGYENTVTYFNGYYNAKRLFSESEDEIRTDMLQTRGKEESATAVDRTATLKVSTDQTTVKESYVTPAYQIPSATKQKLGQVIDKCSNILAFHPTSSLVDDALFLIGKSFYYQADYLKAERKFAELLAQYPNSSLVLETQLWYARTEERLGKQDECVRLCEATISAAHANDEDMIEIQTHQLLGSLYRRTRQNDKSIAEYEKTIALSDNSEVRSSAQISLGDIYFSNGQFGKAAETYLRTEEYTSDIYSNYYSKLHATIAYREMGDYDKALSLVNAMITDFRNKEYLSSLRYERANNEALSGKRDLAIGDYIFVDTTYSHAQYAIRSAYKLGHLYEKELGNYRLALKYYTEVNSSTELDITADGHRKFTALTRYFEDWRKLATADSLFFVLSDTIRKKGQDTLTAAASDTTRRKNTVGNTKAALPNADSLNVLKSIAAHELGDIFYSEVIEPDSAFYWYNKSLSWSYHPARSPRILYILAELSRTYPEKKYPPPEEYLARLDHDYPESIYTEEARRIHGKTSSEKKKDGAIEYYEQAEKLIDTKQYDKAIETLHTIVNSFSKSPLAAKSEYAIGWILENYQAQPESAAVQYKRVAKIYSGTIYASAAAKRAPDILKADTIKTDTTKTNTMKTNMVKADTTKPNTKKTSIIKTDTIKAGLNRTDTMKTVIMKNDTMKTNTIKPDTIKTNINRQKPIPVVPRRKGEADRDSTLPPAPQKPVRQEY